MTARRASPVAVGHLVSPNEPDRHLDPITDIG